MIHTLATAIAEIEARRTADPKCFYSVTCNYSSHGGGGIDWLMTFFRGGKSPAIQVHGTTVGGAMAKLNAMLDEPAITPAEAMASADQALALT
jgi:hypothetical protein